MRNSRRPHLKGILGTLNKPWGRPFWIGVACVLVLFLIWLQRDAAFHPEQADLLTGADAGGVHLRQWAAQAIVWAKKWPRDRYFAPAALAFIGVAYLALAPFWRRAAPPWVRSPWLFDGTVLFALLTLGWPVLSLMELNPDESEHIAEALALLVSPRPWISVDGFSHTPLSAAPLILPVLLHLPIDYGTAKLMHLVGTWANIVLLHRTVRRVYGDVPARLAVIPAMLAMGFVQQTDFQAYNAEVPTTFVLSLGLYLLVRLATLKEINTSSVYFLGLVLGLTPFVKLQGVAPALGLAACGIGVLVYRLWDDRPKCVSKLAILALGGVSVAILLTVYLLIDGAFDSFWNSYILSNWIYAHRNPNTQFWSHARLMRDTSLGLTEMRFLGPNGVVLGVMGAALLPVVEAIRAFRKRYGSPRNVSPAEETGATIVPELRVQLGFLVLALSFVATSAFAVVAPFNQYSHYLWFMMIPLALLAATCLGTLLRAFRSRVALAIGLLAFIVFSGWQQAWHFAANYQPILLSMQPQMVAGDDISLRMLQLDRPGNPVAVWGWMCEDYVNTGMYPATRHAISYYTFEAFLQAYFRGLYLDDLKKNNPVLFVDAVAPKAFWYNQNEYRHEAFPELAAWISAHYRLVDDIRGTRIYVRQ